MSDPIKGAPMSGQLQIFAIKKGHAYELLERMTVPRHMPDSPEVKSGKAWPSQSKHPILAHHVQMQCHPVLHPKSYPLRKGVDPAKQIKQISYVRDVCHANYPMEGFAARVQQNGPKYFMGMRYDGRHGHLGMISVLLGNDNKEVQQFREGAMEQYRGTVPDTDLRYAVKLRASKVMHDGDLLRSDQKAYPALEERDAIEFSVVRPKNPFDDESNVDRYGFPVKIDMHALDDMRSMNFRDSPGIVYVADFNGDNCPDTLTFFSGSNNWSGGALVAINVGHDMCRDMKKVGSRWARGQTLLPDLKASAWVEITPDHDAIAYGDAKLPDVE